MYAVVSFDTTTHLKGENMRFKVFLVFAAIFFTQTMMVAEKEKSEKEKDKGPMSSATFSGLKWRSIGPAYASGRIADFAVNPDNHSEYYVAVACGNIWKTVNAGTTWKPVFDKYGAYSIGCLAMDPNNSNVVWAGTGENNHQRALGYGDGVYKTVDGGKTWKNTGLKESRQVGMIVVDPRNSSVVYVAAEGSVWGPGGDRGLYKTEDGGKTWKKVLEISENTGVNNVVMDPRNPDVLYATSEQRRRHVHTKIGGGPETAIYKSENAGQSWRKLKLGLPSAQMGGIGIAVSPADPDVVYAIILAAEDKGGFYRSTDRGESWTKMSDHHSSGQYYNEIYCDPKDVDKVYSVETITHYTEDGGKTWKRLGREKRHVDDHAMWIDPDDTRHFLIGGDGGVYESWDGGKHYHFKPNLPVTQFYRVNVDDDRPFYNVYGGTQDNNSMGGPSRNTSSFGVVNAEWFVTNGGDGFWTAIDPKDPNIVYAESQYGNMVRYDRKSGESIRIRPEPGKGEVTYRWNWNTPLIISPHSNTRLYCAANKVFRSDDRGDTWKVISDDLTAQIDRNTWPVMGKFWSVDAVAKDVSTSLYGTIVSLDESPVKENLLYIGTDDGVIQVTEDAENWYKINSFPNIPKFTYVSDIQASRYDENTVYAAFDNRKRDDFKPYLLKSADKGKTWTSIAGNLPENGTVHTILEDHVNRNLLFVGTEFGVFFSGDSGEKWIRLKAGIPTNAVRDMAIQRRENDLVLATFGRGFYLLDDYSPLRQVDNVLLEKEAYLFPVKDALMYIQKRSRYGQGSMYYGAKNPPFGAIFTYYLKEKPKIRKQLRKEKEKKLFKEGKPIPQIPYSELRAEEREEKPHLIFTITDESGKVVQRLMEEAKKGINRVVWNLRYSSTSPVQIKKNTFNPLAKASRGSRGMPVMPGKYNVSMALFMDGETKELAEPEPFNAVVLKNTTLPAKDRAELVAFQRDVAEVARTIQGTQRFAEELASRTEYIKQALYNTPAASEDLMKKARKASLEIDDVIFAFKGRTPKASREENPPAPVSINQRLRALVYTHWRSTSCVTQNQRASFDILKEEFPPLLDKLKRIRDVDLKEIESDMEELDAPWTPSRTPKWKY